MASDISLMHALMQTSHSLIENDLLTAFVTCILFSFECKKKTTTTTEN